MEKTNISRKVTYYICMFHSVGNKYYILYWMRFYCRKEAIVLKIKTYSYGFSLNLH